jgi:hypothetical protein
VAGVSLWAVPGIARSAQSANDRIRIGLVGMGGRMHFHVASLDQMAREGNVEIAAICDCDQAKLDGATKVYPELAGKKLARYTDQRKLFDDKSIDAVSFATLINDDEANKLLKRQYRSPYVVPEQV